MQNKIDKKMEVQNDISSLKISSEIEVKQFASKQSSFFLSNIKQKMQIKLKSGEYKISDLTNDYENIKSYSLIIEEGQNVVIIDDTKTSLDEYLIDIYTVLEKKSSLNYLALDSLTGDMIKIYRYFEVNEDAKLTCNTLNLTTQKLNHNIVIDLNEKKAEADVNLVTVSKDISKNEYDVRINNNAPDTKANIWQKGVVSNKGVNKFLATGFIKKGADNAENFQESRVLLLNEASIGDASPLLLIDHYNVKAGHAASVSRVNEDELYYLMSRGISKVESERLITLAFIRPFFDRLIQTDLADELFEKITETLS